MFAAVSYYISAASYFSLMLLYFCTTDPEEVDPALLQLCSSQLKLLQLYTDVQQLHSVADMEAGSENVSAHTEFVNGSHMNCTKP